MEQRQSSFRASRARVGVPAAPAAGRAGDPAHDRGRTARDDGYRPAAAVRQADRPLVAHRHREHRAQGEPHEPARVEHHGHPHAGMNLLDQHFTQAFQTKPCLRGHAPIGRHAALDDRF